jgi:chromate transporter
VSAPPGSTLEVLGAFLRLGLTSFGGPIAHLGYFRDEFVARTRWLDERTYADLVALCQFLPGPASSQVGMAIGIARAGMPGAIAAWVGFTLPSALALIAFAYGLAHFGGGSSGWLHGLKVVAVAVVAQAVWGMARSLTPDRPRITLAILAALVVLAWPTAFGQVGAIVAGGIAGRLWLRAPAGGALTSAAFPVRRSWAIVAWIAFFALLGGLPLAVKLTGNPTVAVIDGFYRAGSLVFGGGHVVLPLLQAEVVPPGWVSNDAFLAGYGAAQAVPGPLFTFAAYLGTVMTAPPGGWLGGLMCLVAIFVPAFLLVVGALPFWDALPASAAAQSALAGINAAVVGLLLAALYNPVWTSAIRGPADFGLALAAFGLLVFWRVPPWLVVALTAASGAALAAL